MVELTPERRKIIEQCVAEARANGMRSFQAQLLIEAWEHVAKLEERVRELETKLDACRGDFE